MEAWVGTGLLQPTTYKAVKLNGSFAFLPTVLGDSVDGIGLAVADGCVEEATTWAVEDSAEFFAGRCVSSVLWCAMNTSASRRCAHVIDCVVFVPELTSKPQNIQAIAQARKQKTLHM